MPPKPIPDDLTIEEAADLLNVSQPYLVRVLDEGRIPFGYVGTNRRVKPSDVLDYKRKLGDEAEAAADELACEGQKLGIY